MRILITGATGFIGSYIVEALLAERHEVRALVRKTSRTAALKAQGVDLIFGDVADLKSLDAIEKKFDSIIHCAAYVADKNPEKLRTVNVVGTENICRLSLRLGVERLVYLSSVAVISGNEQIPLTEDLPYSATNLYGESKIEAEKKVLEYRKKGLRAAILRPPMVYGEGEPHLLRLILRLLKMRLLFLPNQGMARWHLCYVRHVAEAARLAMHDERFLEGSFFAGDFEVLTCAEIFGLLAQGIGAPAPILLSEKTTKLLRRIPILDKKLKFMLKDRVYDLARITQAGFVPQRTAQEALIQTARWYAHGRG